MPCLGGRVARSSRWLRPSVIGIAAVFWAATAAAETMVYIGSADGIVVDAASNEVVETFDIGRVVRKSSTAKNA